MEPIAYGFMIMVGTAAIVGIVSGAIGGAVVWRLRSNLVLGCLLTTCGFLLLLLAGDRTALSGWVRAKLTWGVPSMMLTFLLSSISARWLEAHTTLRPAWTALAAFGFALGAGLLYLYLFSLEALPRAGLWAVVGLVVLLLLLRVRRPVRARRPAQSASTGPEPK